MSTELSVLPWLLIGVGVLALIIGLLARPLEVLPGKRWAWKEKELK